jgi:hypothetical protein
MTREWLDNLKVGDKVAIDTGRFGDDCYRIVKIDRITPSRQIIAGGYRFIDGRGSYKQYGSRRPSICPVTDEIVHTTRKVRLLERLRAIDFRSFDATALQIMCDALDKIEEARKP